MAEFIFTPSSVRDPRNHPRRIYFSCHPDDMIYFETISEQIREIEKDCVIAYADTDGDIELRQKEILDFHLTVIPITERWFSEGTHVNEFTLLTTKHKAILPILLDNSFEERFNVISGNLQFLRYQDNEFNEKLRITLQNILFDSSLLERVSSVFTHKMFISYCREDAEQVTKLIDIIHSAKGGKRVSVWYDKYLPSGRNFEESIISEIDARELFAVTLTSNLLNRNNYVKDTEYPRARTFKKHEKKIVFFKMVPVDEEIFELQFKPNEEKDHFISLDDGNKYLEMIHQLLKESKSNSAISDPVEVEYLLALAYQNGIFVEFDHNYAIQKFKNAANGNIPEAAHNLANIYYYGLGVNRDIDKAIEWYKKEIKIAEECYKKETSRIEKLQKNADFTQFDTRNNQLFVRSGATNNIREYVKELRITTNNHLSRCNNNARLISYEGRTNDAIQIYDSALRAIDHLEQILGQNTLTVHYREIIKNEKNTLLFTNGKLKLEDAKNSWNNCLEYYNEDPSEYLVIHLLLSSAHNYGRALLKAEQFEKAKDVMFKAIEVFEVSSSIREIGEDRSLYELIISMNDYIGKTYFYEDNCDEDKRDSNVQNALHFFEKVERLLENMPFDINENPMLYTKKPWISFYKGRVYERSGDMLNSYKYDVKALHEMNEVEKILGESVTTQDFPIVLLQFYSHCMESISDYFIFENVPEDANSILENAIALLARFEENEFFGYHKEVSEHSLDLLREAIDRMSSVIE